MAELFSKEFIKECFGNIPESVEVSIKFVPDEIQPENETDKVAGSIVAEIRVHIGDRRPPCDR